MKVTEKPVKVTEKSAKDMKMTEKSAQDMPFKKMVKGTDKKSAEMRRLSWRKTKRGRRPS